MNLHEIQQARDYLSPPKNGFWKWSDASEAVLWTDGSTIAFAKELAEILQPQQSRGLPRFGAVLLLIAATRDNWFRTDDFAKTELPRDILERVIRQQYDSYEPLESILLELGRIHRLDNDVRLSVDAKKVMIDVVFEASGERTSPDVATQVLAVLDDNVEASFHSQFTTSIASDGSLQLFRDLTVLKHPLPKVTAESLRSRRESGLVDSPRPAEIEIDIPVRLAVRSLLTELKDDPQLSGMASAARQLMSVLTLPKPISQPDEIAEGGVSDISNRGPLTRLLISELANDDLTLAVRVAVNEALYLRHESPQCIAQRKRIVILDTGLRMWGIPRVLATSFAMALAANSQSRDEFLVWSTDGAELHSVSLTTRAGIHEHLKTLRHEMHPGECLGRVKKLREDFDGDCELVLVTSPATLKDAAFRKCLALQALDPLYVGTVARDGVLQLHEFTAFGKKLIKQVTVDIDEIVNDKPIMDKRVATDLPAIFGVSPFPLFLPQSFDVERCWPIGPSKVISFASDNRLMLWEERNRGARQLSDRIESAKVLWSSPEMSRSSWYAIVGSSQSYPRRLVRVRPDNKYDLGEDGRGAAEQFTLDIDPSPLGFCCHSDAIYAIYDDHVSRIDLATGKSLQHSEIPDGLTWKRGRFFQSASLDWFVLSHSEPGVRFARIPMRIKHSQVVGMFDSTFVEGPLAVTSDGRMYEVASESLHRIDHGLDKQIRLHDVSHDGERFILLGNGGRHYQPYVAIDTASRTIVGGNSLLFGRTPYPGRNIRHRFSTISIREDGSLSLSSRKQSRLDIVCDADGMRLRSKPDSATVHFTTEFESVASPTGTGFGLKLAKWPDGSRVWLDSRGLLHLRSSDRDIPEISIVLTDKSLAGWCSDGNVWGAEYFIGGNPTIDHKAVFESVIQPFVKKVFVSC